jgi:hypothetical protein
LGHSNLELVCFQKLKINVPDNELVELVGTNFNNLNHKFLSGEFTKVKNNHTIIDDLFKDQVFTNMTEIKHVEYNLLKSKLRINLMRLRLIQSLRLL